MFTFFFQCENQGLPVQGAESWGTAKGGAASFSAWVILVTPHYRVQMIKSYLSSEKGEEFTD